MAAEVHAPRAPLSVSVVIPVYNGAATLPDLVAELRGLRSIQRTPNGREYRVDEVLLVWDRGADGSDRVIRELSRSDSWVRPIWLSRNFGQHAATVAGMTSSGGDWIVTMDEDGQHDPAYIGQMLDVAYAERAQLVYASPTTPPPHGFLRNTASRDEVDLRARPDLGRHERVPQLSASCPAKRAAASPRTRDPRSTSTSHCPG